MVIKCPECKYKCALPFNLNFQYSTRHEDKMGKCACGDKTYSGICIKELTQQSCSFKDESGYKSSSNSSSSSNSNSNSSSNPSSNSSSSFNSIYDSSSNSNPSANSDSSSSSSSSCSSNLNPDSNTEVLIRNAVL